MAMLNNQMVSRHTIHMYTMGQWHVLIYAGY